MASVSLIFFWGLAFTTLRNRKPVRPYDYGLVGWVRVGGETVSQLVTDSHMEIPESYVVPDYDALNSSS